MSETVAAAEDEDRLVAPAQWRQIMYPRRGTVDGDVRVPTHTGSTAALEALRGTAVEAEARSCLDNPRTLPRVHEALREELSGNPSPIGTAALSLLAVDYRGADLPAHLNAWVAAYGLPFAAAATAEAGRLSVQKARRDFPAAVIEANGECLPSQGHGVARMLRTYLAAASDEDYASAVRELAGHRSDLRQRVIVSYLLPTESAWLAEVCAEVGTVKLPVREWRSMVALLHCSVSRPEELAALRKRMAFHPNLINPAVLATATLALGTNVVGLFPAALDSRETTVDVRRMILDFIARIPCDESLELLTSRLTKKHIQAAVIDAAQRFPRRAIRLLARAACLRGENAEAARSLLTDQLVRHAALVAEVRPALAADERALVDRLCLRAVGRPEAPASALPPVLVSPPWTRKRPRKVAVEGSAAVDFGGLVAPAVSRVAWKAGEREGFEHRHPPLRKAKDWRQTLDQIEAHGTSGSSHQDRFALLQAPDEDARRALPHLRAEFDGWDQVDAFGAILVRFDTDAIGPILYRAPGADLTRRAVLLQPIVDVRVARLMADWLLRLKSVRSHAKWWLERHCADAATLLIPDALGSDKGLRNAAEGALRYLAGLEFDVTDVAQRVYGADAAIAVKAIVDADPLDLVPARPPKLADWLRDTRLPQILLPDRRTALPVESVRHVLTMLAISRPREPYAGLEIVREHVDPVSLAAFGRALLTAWRALDYPSKESWILPAQSVLGDAETVRSLVPLIRSWPRESAHQRAVAGLDVLTEFDTDYAHLQVHLIAQSLPKKALNHRAKDTLESVAAKLNLTSDQLADRLIPDFGLDAGAALWLDYGPRRVHVCYDELLWPTLVDELGALCPGGILPEPAATDDAELAEAAQARLSGLNEDVVTLTTHVIQRMESGMAMCRSWTAAEFRGRLLNHPLLWHLVCRVVWLCEVDGSATAFRVDEERHFTDVNDDVFVLPDNAIVRVAHPLHLGADLGTWAELFADYEILQPFVQLGRPVYALTGEEHAGAPFNRFEGITVPSGEVRGLLERGWDGAHRVSGIEQHLVRATPDGRWLILSLEPGIGMVSDADDTPRQQLGAIALGSVRDAAELAQGAQSSSLDGLDAITVSELLYDLYSLSDR